MTIKTIPKKPIIATIAATILLGTVLIASSAFTNNVIAQAVDPTTPCPPPNEVQHWDKIIFQIKNDNNDQENEIIKKLIDENAVLDIKVLDDPEVVVDLGDVARASLISTHGISQGQADNLEIEIIDVLYETVNCAEQGPQGIQGPQGPVGADGATGPAGVPCTNCVGGNEIIGTSKLIFGSCTVTVPNSSHGIQQSVICSEGGVVIGDKIIAHISGGGGCFDVVRAQSGVSGDIAFVTRNLCNFNSGVSSFTINYIVFS